MNLNLKNKLINGDSLKELKKIPDETFDLIFADPPYNLQLKSELTRPDTVSYTHLTLPTILRV